MPDDTRIPVRDKYGNITGYRGSGAQAEQAVFNGRPGGLAAAADKAKAKASPASSPSPTPTDMSPAQGMDDEKKEKYRKMREAEEADEAKAKKPPMPRKKPTPTDDSY